MGFGEITVFRGKIHCKSGGVPRNHPDFWGWSVENSGRRLIRSDSCCRCLDSIDTPRLRSILRVEKQKADISPRTELRSGIRSYIRFFVKLGNYLGIPMFTGSDVITRITISPIDVDSCSNTSSNPSRWDSHPSGIHDRSRPGIPSRLTEKSLGTPRLSSYRISEVSSLP